MVVNLYQSSSGNNSNSKSRSRQSYKPLFLSCNIVQETLQRVCGYYKRLPYSKVSDLY